MNPSPAQPTATTTFVVRFWHEWAGETARWRGRIEHVESGQQASFLEIEDLPGFLQRFGIGVATPPAEKRDNRAPGTGEPGVTAPP